VSSPSQLEVYARHVNDLALRWQAGTMDSGRYWLVTAPGTQAPDTCDPGPRLADITGTEYVASGLSADLDYAFRLCGIDETADGKLAIGDGVVASGRTLALAPGEPSSLSVVQPDVSIAALDLMWHAAQGAVGYLVAYAPGGSPPASCTGGTQTYATAMSLPGLTPGQTYSVRVCAINGNPTPDVSGGITASAYVHSQLVADPTGITLDWLAPEWVRLHWTSSSDVRVSVGTQVDASGCPTADLTTARGEYTAWQLQPDTTYYVRLCASNGDSQPLFGGGATTYFHTPRRVAPHVSSLACEDIQSDPDILWNGPDSQISYYATTAPAASATTAPLCTSQNAYNLYNYSSSAQTGWRTNGMFSAQYGDNLWVRICSYTNGVWDQGQVIYVSMPYIAGIAIMPGYCSGGQTIVEPTLTVSATLSNTTIYLSGYCNHDGDTIYIGGDVLSESAICSGSQWSTTVPATGTEPLRITAEAWNGSYESHAQFATVQP
jgi:hypothetical protein